MNNKPAAKLKQLQRKLERRDLALEEQDEALAQAHATIRVLKDQELISGKKLRDAEKRIEKLIRESPLPSPTHYRSPNRRASPLSNDSPTHARRKGSPLTVSRRSSFTHDEEVQHILAAVDAAVKTPKKRLYTEQDDDNDDDNEKKQNNDSSGDEDDLICNHLSVDVDFEGFDSSTERQKSSPGTPHETIASITKQDAATAASVLTASLTIENNELRDQIEAMFEEKERINHDTEQNKTLSLKEKDRLKIEIKELQELVQSLKEEGMHQRSYSGGRERSGSSLLRSRSSFASVDDEGVEVNEEIGQETKNANEEEENKEQDPDTAAASPFSPSTSTSSTTSTPTSTPITTATKIIPTNRDATRLSVLLTSPLTPVPNHLHLNNKNTKKDTMSTPEASLIITQAAQAAKNALIASRTCEVGVQCDLTGSLLSTSSFYDDEEEDENENEDENEEDRERQDIQTTEEYQKRVRRLHHWHALTGSADLLTKNPGAYEYLLQKVVVEPTESKAIVRDARCTYAVTSMSHKRNGSTTPASVKTTNDNNNNNNNNNNEYELTPFASSLCNILSCFCTMLDIKYTGGQNYIAGYCLIVCRGDEEVAFWLFVSIYKKVKILFECQTLSNSQRVMEVFGSTLNKNLTKLAKHMEKYDVDPKIWMLSNLQTLFSRNTYPRNYTKAVWDAFLVSHNPMEVLVRIAVSMIELMSDLIFSAHNHSEIIQLLQNPPVDLIRAEPLLTHALKYTLNVAHVKELQELSEQ